MRWGLPAAGQEGLQPVGEEVDDELAGEDCGEKVIDLLQDQRCLRLAAVRILKRSIQLRLRRIGDEVLICVQDTF